MHRPSSASPARTPQQSRPLSRGQQSTTPLTESPGLTTPATSTSTRGDYFRGGTPSSERVLSGRIRKTPRQVAARRGDVLSEKEKEAVRRQLDEMNEEKKLFPGSENWAEDELNLFRILYMRQYSPLLPSHWQTDFLGQPIPDILFASSEAHPPIIYSRSNEDYKATKALERLVQLTTDVRGLVQAGQRHKAPALIEKELLTYTRWAARDGGYDKLEIVPNIIIDLVDNTMSPLQVEDHMRQQLKVAAERHREYWRGYQSPVDTADRKKTDHLSEHDADEAEPEDSSVVLVPDKYPSSPLRNPPMFPPSSPPRAEGSNGGQSLKISHPLRSTQFFRKPPVIYGLFIVNTSVMVLTIDSSKEEDATISFQVEMGFNKRGQSAWNAITIAIVVCLARDALMEMKEDFGDAISSGESDPDA
ncbi:hypothetical protein CMUS01_05172 [Colletotrichum musicola]|uniref:Uncharacterized protein n=1 Tax=Colletotrichum musicola TaxID=2175873 RepID=A0A8H6KSU4_9PEZI|nr:hypothetical protein CMUS01_05172 [Colletotrichum musicola]